LSKNSFCVGEDGKQAIIEGKRFFKEQLDKEKALISTDDGTTSKKNSKDGVGGFAKAGTGINHANAADKKREERPNFNKSGIRTDGWDRDGDFDALNRHQKIDNEKLMNAMEEEKKRKNNKEAKKPKGFGLEDESPEIIEAKRLLRERQNDPMATGNSDELLPLNGGNNDQLRQTA